jgi:hypothetical protein
MEKEGLVIYPPNTILVVDNQVKYLNECGMNVNTYMYFKTEADLVNLVNKLHPINREKVLSILN